ncbi:MAG: CocE/NonD family hydrolase [bacterium]|nr:CocE/NonD family hydrolase [bacterium]
MRTLAVFLAMAALTFVAGAADQSRPFEYTGDGGARFASHELRVAYVPMSDGVHLAVDIFLPAEGPEAEAFPVILEYTPYQRSEVNPKTGEVNDAGSRHEVKRYLAHGYAFAAAEMRGTGASSGWMLDFMPQLADDGKELVDWIGAQPWCDGNVGMMGGSYLGWSQTATASRKPEALKCIIPAVIPLDGYTGEAFPGGIYLEGFVKGFSQWQDVKTLNYLAPGMFLPSRPAVDEDGDGEYLDEIPLDVDEDGTFLNDGYPPKYADGQDREQHVFFNATEEHEKNYSYHGWASRPQNAFIDSDIPTGITMYDQSPAAHVPGMMESGIPMYHIGGWFDGFTRGSFLLYATMAETNPSKLVVGPSYHNPMGGPWWEYFGEDKAAQQARYTGEMHRFFDRYLKGVENGIDNEPPIYIYCMHGGGWRFENEWPLEREKVVSLFMDDGHRLSLLPGSHKTDIYQADLTHSSMYTESKGNRWVGIGNQVPKTPPMRTDKDEQSLYYTSPPMTHDVEVTGHPVVRFHAESTLPDHDFFVYLSDVDENGEAMLVTEGQFRAGFAGLYDNDTIILGGGSGIDVKPDVPWHGYRREQYDPEVFADNAIVEIVIDFFPTSWVFRKGHSVRVSIACVDTPTFPIHPNVSPDNDPMNPENVAPLVTVHRGAAYPSRVELPVVPGETD